MLRTLALATLLLVPMLAGAGSTSPFGVWVGTFNAQNPVTGEDLGTFDLELDIDDSGNNNFGTMTLSSGGETFVGTLRNLSFSGNQLTMDLDIDQVDESTGQPLYLEIEATISGNSMSGQLGFGDIPGLEQFFFIGSFTATRDGASPQEVVVQRISLPEAPAPGSRFGRVVATAGEFACIGQPDFQSGRVAVFRQGQGGSSAFSGFLELPPGLPFENFGATMSYADDRLIVGAPLSLGSKLKGSNPLTLAIFERTSQGLLFKETISPSNTRPDDMFGTAVAIEGDTMVVGAPGDDEGETAGMGSGAVFVFREQGGSFVQTNKIKPINGQPNQGFGTAVATSDSTIAVANNTALGGSLSNNVSLYQQVGDNLQAMGAVSGEEGDEFGSSIALDGSTLVVGAPGADVNGTDSGAVYQFNVGGNSVSMTNVLAPDDAGAGARFGSKVDVAGLEVVVGAPGAEAAGGASGATYRFLNEVLTDRLAALGAAGSNPAQQGFGAALSLSEGKITVGAPETASAAGGGAIISGLTKAERLLQLDLPVDPSFGCPGFYIARVASNNGAVGRWSMEILLEPGVNPLLQGGLNLGGGFGDVEAPGFAAFNIANSTNTRQVVTGTVNVTKDPDMQYQVTVVRRMGSERIPVFTEQSTADSLNFEVTLDPGFHVVQIRSEGNEVNGTGSFDMSLATRFVNRPGGAFQGGVNVGGILNDATDFDVDSGFAAICISTAQNVQFKTQGSSAFGANGINDMRLGVRNRNRDVIAADPQGN